jgi:aminopeptidase
MERIMERTAAGEFRWSLTLFPTQAYAAEAEMSLAEYEDFYYRACLCDRPDPVAAWREQSEEIRRLADWMSGKEEVRITGPGTDLTRGSTTCPTASSSPARSRTRRAGM